MVNSDLVLCVRGNGNYSYRLYETLSAGRIPLLVDTDCQLPWERFIDWDSCLIRVDQKDIGTIDQRVMDWYSSVHPDDYLQMQYNARQLWLDWLTPRAFYANLYRCLQSA